MSPASKFFIVLVALILFSTAEARAWNSVVPKVHNPYKASNIYGMRGAMNGDYRYRMYGEYGGTFYRNYFRRSYLYGAERNTIRHNYFGKTTPQGLAGGKRSSRSYSGAMMSDAQIAAAEASLYSRF